MLSNRPLILAALGLTAILCTNAAAPPRAVALEAAAESTALGLPPADLTPQDGEHPLEPIIRWGKASAEKLRQLEGYSCTLVKRERLRGKLGRQKIYALKVRHRPFSVYLGTPLRNGRRDEEVIFVEGRNDGMMWGHSERYRHLGTVSLYPGGRRMLKESRYPLTDIGMVNLIERLVEVAEKDVHHDECEVKVFTSAKLQKRPCWCVTVTHPERRDHFLFYLARIWVDQALEVPVRYESYTWPREADGPPVLMEEYTYLNFRFDPVPAGRDFDIRNPSYDFPEKSGDGAEPFASVQPPARAPRAIRQAPQARLQAPAPQARVQRPPPQAQANEARRAAEPITDGHPLDAVLATARRSLERLENVRDYSCIFAKRETIEGELSEREYLALKIRHQPFSVYAYSLGPTRLEGEEAIYVEGTHDGKVLAHGTGLRARLGGTMRLAPDHRLLMKGNRFPITELGIEKLLAKLINQFETELTSDDCTVAFYPDRQINDRTCTCAQVVYQTPRPGRPFHLTRLYFDDEREIPIRFEGYGWPSAGQTEPPLVEEYTYLDVRLDRGLTDFDFDVQNPDYAFPLASGLAEEPTPPATESALRPGGQK